MAQSAQRRRQHYLQQSVCLLPATPATTRAATKVVTRLRAEGGQGEVLRIRLVDREAGGKVIDAMQAERTDEYHELVESTRQFHEELAIERRRGRATYTELEESDADLARYRSGSPPSGRGTTSTHAEATEADRRRRLV